MHLLATNLQATRLQCIRTLRWKYMRVRRLRTLQSIHYASVRNAIRWTRYCESSETGKSTVWEKHRVSDCNINCCSRVQLKCDGTRRRTGGEVKGKLANGVGSQYSSHNLGTWCNQHYYTADAHTSCASIRLNWRPCRFKWTRPFRRKTKSGFCASVITFQTQYAYTNHQCLQRWLY